MAAQSGDPSAHAAIDRHRVRITRGPAEEGDPQTLIVAAFPIIDPSACDGQVLGCM
jgi:hypothetical protein